MRGAIASECRRGRSVKIPALVAAANERKSMTEEEVTVAAGSLAFACILLGLRQLIFRGRRHGPLITPPDRDDGDSRRDDSSDDWPSEIAVAEEPSSAAEASPAGATTATRAGIISALALLFLCATSDAARAQQTIFNVPSTDVLDRGKVYFELDASFKPNDSEALGHFSSFVPRVVVGAGRRVELGLNVTGNVQPGPDATTLVPVVKYKFYDGKDNGFAVVGGDQLFIPVRNRAYNAGNYAYLEFSKTFKKSGTRLTAGGYDFTKSVVASANRAGGQFGFEQPLSKKVTLAADYLTGKHSAGYFTPGVVFKVNAKVTGYAGYSIGNQNPSRGNHFFLLELGYNFN
jgi:hypothetical protein